MIREALAVVELIADANRAAREHRRIRELREPIVVEFHPTEAKA